MLIFMSLFPSVVSFFTRLAGIQSPVNLVFLAIIFILIIKLFSMTVKISELENKTKELTQKIAIDKTLEYEKELEALESLQEAAATREEPLS